MIVTSICAIKELWNLPDFFNSLPSCPHNFSFHTLSLYFLFDMSYNSSHLRTNSINFSSISEDNQAALTASKHSKRSYCSHYQNRAGSDRFRHVKRSRSATATERNWDETETFLSVRTSPLKLHMKKFYWTVTFRDGTQTWRIMWVSPKPARPRVGLSAFLCDGKISFIVEVWFLLWILCL
jgi:hypothetical protein